MLHFAFAASVHRGIELFLSRGDSYLLAARVKAHLKINYFFLLMQQDPPDQLSFFYIILGLALHLCLSFPGTFKCVGGGGG